MRLLLTIGPLLMAFGSEAGGFGSFKQDIERVVRQGQGTPEGRAAWDRLSRSNADALVPLLEAMNTKDTVASNWLRTAFEQIANRESKAKDKAFDTTTLLAFVKNPANMGRPRRFALELIENARPGTSEALFREWLDDPEFRYEAVAQVLERARKVDQAGKSPSAVDLYRLAFDKSRDVQQARDAAHGLLLNKIEVSVADHLGFLLDWYLIGPFDGMKQKGFHLSYPPEKKIDLGAELDGKAGKIRWKRYQAKEPRPSAKGGHQALVSLRDKAALGDADDAVGYAYTEFTIPNAMEAEMRGSADDNLTVWVNGVKAFAFEEWRNGVRLDRHRFPVRLNAGKNSVLVKVCQSEAPNPEPNWEFLLRVVDSTGKSIPMTKRLK